MSSMTADDGRWNPAALWRIGCTFVAIVVVEGTVCGLSALPVVLIWLEVQAWLTREPVIRAVVFGMLVVPSYMAFALCLMPISALATRVTGARTPPDASLRIADMGWPLMRWARYMIASHLVRLLAGSVFRGSPVWTAYLRLNGARIGKRVYVNSLFISDHNLLEIGDGTVIGGEVHLSGHTVEGGLVKTGRVRLGRDVTIGLGSVIDIGVTVGARCQVGALSLVPKHTTLEPDTVYAGIPVRRLDRASTVEV
jgi:non-ribosomal peptide synthetase-like protein